MLSFPMLGSFNKELRPVSEEECLVLLKKLSNKCLPARSSSNLAFVYYVLYMSVIKVGKNSNNPFIHV